VKKEDEFRFWCEEEKKWLWRKKRMGDLWGRRIQPLYKGHVRVFIFIFFVAKIHVGCLYGTK